MSIAPQDPASLPPRIREFRKTYRQQVVGAWYNGWLHFGFVVTGSIAIILLALGQLGYDRHGNPATITLIDWLCIPSTLLVANIVEYLGHRGPMHHRRKGLSLLFQRHTDEHHQFFTDDWMTCRSARDYKIVLFPPIMLFTYLGLVALPAGALTYLLTTRNAACLAIATSMFYFVSYEILHFTYHIDENTRVGRLWMIRVLREHHRIHHSQKLMSRYNFNITWPVADFLFGTVYKGPKSPPAERLAQPPAGADSEPAIAAHHSSAACGLAAASEVAAQ
jgi:hypothetical protein